jgi:hypothetical protein
LKPFVTFALVLKKVYRALLMLAMAILLGHNFTPHHHDIEALNYYDHNEGPEHDNDEHNIFSFAHLDENFFPSESCSVNIDLPVAYLLTPLIGFQLRQLQQVSKTHFGYYREYPPPAIYLSGIPLRAPPVFVAV